VQQNKIKSTIGIFTVKSIHKHLDRYYTYGGFGKYLETIRHRFTGCVLIAHVRDAPPRQGDYEIPSGNIKIIGLPPIRNELEALLTLPIQFIRCWKSVKLFDIAHARMPDYTGIVGALVCRIQKKPFFCQIIDDWGLLARKTPWEKKYGLGLFLKIHLSVYDYCERLVCRNQMVFAQGSTCHRKHANSSDATLVFSSSHSLVDVITPKPRFTTSSPVILNVGRFNAVKNQSLLIDTLVLLRNRGENWRLRLIGQGPHQDALLQKASGLGVMDAVEFIGKVKHGNDLWTHFDNADVFALSSLSEGTPKVLLEAMARGLPIVATAVSGVPDMVPHKVRGLLLEEISATFMASAISEMRNNTALREYCVNGGFEFAKNNTVEIQIDQMLNKVQNNIYQKANQKKGSYVA